MSSATKNVTVTMTEDEKEAILEVAGESLISESRMDVSTRSVIVMKHGWTYRCQHRGYLWFYRVSKNGDLLSLRVNWQGVVVAYGGRH